ncbi:mechanosensitive ion channel domain-containing protein [Methanoculleus sp. MH98A]|uniref:mechanosensitive ion channel domain-containing protein n=1 Tax=Methanoculleus sp. MH98A TaxID=1495314 RepID=UPI000A58FA3B|nr:mechanosensitive ion channel domain-containing protein [Methanoculleus sp. MH98A]
MEIAEILSFPVPLSDITIESVVLAVLVAIIGWIVVKVLTSVFTKMLSRASKLPALVIEFLVRFFSVLLYVILALIVLATLGFDVSSMVLGLSAVIGLILGFGLQDTVTNLAAGVWRRSAPSTRVSSSRSTAYPGRSPRSASWRPSC